MLENANIFLPRLLCHKGILVLIRTVTVAALRLDGNYCGCFAATEIANEEESILFARLH